MQGAVGIRSSAAGGWVLLFVRVTAEERGGLLGGPLKCIVDISGGV